MEYKNLQEKREKYKKLLEISLNRIVEKLKEKVEKIILIGSYIKRKDLFTDLDIIVIMDTDKPFLDRVKEIYSLLELPVDADILCYTPLEYLQLRQKKLFKQIEKEGIILYEKKSN